MRHLTDPHAFPHEVFTFKWYLLALPLNGIYLPFSNHCNDTRNVCPLEKQRKLSFPLYIL